MSRKLKILILVNLVLLTSVVVSLTLPSSKNTTNESITLFETAQVDAIEKIVIDGKEIALDKRRWKVNNEYEVRPAKINTLLGILTRLEIKRSVEQNPQAIIASADTTFRVEAYGVGENKQFGFTIGSSGSEIWLQEEENGTLHYVYVPGFFFELPTYFAVEKSRWRNRKILATSWQSLQKLEVNYTGDPENSFAIAFDSVFYRVEGVNTLDSAAVYNYITLYENFEVSGFVEDATIRDSLEQTLPLCTVIVEDIKPELGGKLLIYPGPQRVFGKLEKGNEIVTLNPRMLSTYLVSRDFFVRR